VNEAATGDPVFITTQSPASYDFGRLEFGQSYYWRVDEVNGAPDFTTFKGDVWSFTTEPVGCKYSSGYKLFNQRTIHFDS